jgi:membrane associated rhomboid family serine protease
MRSNWGGGGWARGGGGSWLPFSLGGIPVVRGLLIAITATFLVHFATFQSGAPLVRWLAFSAGAPDWYVKPWTWLTYALLEVEFLNLLFQGFWLFVVGSILERSWGSRNFLALFFIFAAISALGFVPAYYLFGAPVALVGLVLPLSSLTVAWAAMDPEQEIFLWGVLPLKLKTLALIDVLIVYFSFGFGYGPLPALLTLVGPAAAFYYVRKLPRLDLGFQARPSRREPLLREDRPGRERPPRERVPRESAPGLNPLRRRQEREEMERLRKLLGEDDDSSATRN